MDLQFPNGLITVTGETGAGKSILLGALGLLMGNRADHSVLMDAQTKCIVEGEFDIHTLGLESFFEVEDLDYSSTTIIRREIAPGGKSRCFINDTPVSLAQAKTLGTQLLDIHTQHTHLLVTQKEEQLHLLDEFAENGALLDEYERAFHRWSKIISEIEKFETEQQSWVREREFNQFQFDELLSFQPVSGEESQLESEITLLSQSEDVKAALMGSHHSLSNADAALLDGLNSIRSHLKKFRGINPELDSLFSRLDEASFELNDISESLSNWAESMVYDPIRLQAANERQAKLQNLLRKHQAESSDDLLAIMKELETALTGVQDQEDHIKALRKEKALLDSECERLAERLHQCRSKAGIKWCQELTQMLHRLDIPDAKIECKWDYKPGQFKRRGSDELSLQFTANKGLPTRDLDKVASGGELSRLNFSIRSLGAAKRPSATLIYDEADTGISGPIALQMGQMLRSMGQHMQTVAITHLPQVASAGNHQLFVFKDRDSDQTKSQFKWLDRDQRIHHLAQLLSHENPSDSALKNAEELLDSFLESE
jgi:DNA repair protein RecN (Recombination protein N)